MYALSKAAARITETLFTDADKENSSHQQCSVRRNTALTFCYALFLDSASYGNLRSYLIGAWVRGRPRKSAHCSRSSTWSAGQRKGSGRDAPGMVPVCGAHQRSAPHHSAGSTSARRSAPASASAFRICARSSSYGHLLSFS